MCRVPKKLVEKSASNISIYVTVRGSTDAMKLFRVLNTPLSPFLGTYRVKDKSGKILSDTAFNHKGVPKRNAS